VQGSSDAGKHVKRVRFGWLACISVAAGCSCAADAEKTSGAAIPPE
jgi:hypothetical protein